MPLFQKWQQIKNIKQKLYELKLISPHIYPSQILIKAPNGGLSQNSIALGEQLRALSKTRLLRLRGILDRNSLTEPNKALAIALELD